MKPASALFVILIIVVILIGLNRGWWVNQEPPHNGDWGNIPPGNGSRGVLPIEQEMLNWLQRNGCSVEIPESLTQTYKFFEDAGIPYDKFYLITWKLEFKDVIPYQNSGDPVIPSPGVYTIVTRGGHWSSAGDSYNDLIKIKEDFQKDVAAGYVVK